MTLHIYQAHLLHYISEDDLAKRTAAELSDTRIPEFFVNLTVDKDTTLLPVIAGVRIYPEYIADGALVVDDVTRCVVEYGHSETILPKYANAEGKPAIKVHDYRDKLIMPGFIDTHVHYPQIDMIAAYGEQLLDWLNNYTFVTEANFGDPKIAHDTAQFFLNQLLANGTTSAMVFATSHPLSAEAHFGPSRHYP